MHDLKDGRQTNKPVVDSRTPKELIDIIEAKGQEVADTLAVLRNVAMQ